MKVCQQSIHQTEIESGINEQITESCRGMPEGIFIPCQKFEASSCGCSHCYQMASLSFIGSYLRRRGFLDLKVFRFHPMLFYVFAANGLKGPVPNVEQQFAYWSASIPEALQYAVGEMKPCSRRRYRSCMAGINRLIARFVFCPVLPPIPAYIGRKWRLSYSLDKLFQIWFWLKAEHAAPKFQYLRDACR